MPGGGAIPVYAHRFGSGYGPESSRAALEAALSHEVDGIEADVILTADDEVFALHDPELSLVTIIPAIKAILDSPDLRLDAFMGRATSPR